MSTVRYRRTMILLASAGGNTVPVIAHLVQADEVTVRDVIHRFNEVGLACAGATPTPVAPTCRPPNAANVSASVTRRVSAGAAGPSHRPPENPHPTW